MSSKIKKMTHTYHISGMTCENCEAKVKSSLLSLPDVLAAEVSKDTSNAVITMQKHIPLSELQKALGGSESKYQIAAPHHSEITKQTKSWLTTYKPILILFAFIIGISLLAQFNQPFDYMMWMRHFMVGFFLAFSFFKLLDLEGFADSYSMYDILAKRFKAWGYIYAFVELGLGISYLINFDPFVTNLVTASVMSLSIIGVLQSVLNHKKIQCACLGAVFNLPMSTVTIVEDALMIIMSVSMLLHL